MTKQTEPRAAQGDDQPAVLSGTPVRPKGPPDWPPGDPEVAEILQKALKDKTWGRYHGPHCRKLSEQLTEFHATRQAILCCSGTAAVELALRGLKVGPGDEVILAAYDFKGNFQNVLRLGATPVLADIAPDNWNLDLDQLEAALGPQTKAVVVSHLHGGIVAMPKLMQMARQAGVAVIEDACQMPGARIEGHRAGTWGDVGILSFGGSKLLSAGRGGALLTSDSQVAQRIRLETQRGNETYPLSELQAAVLIPQLTRLEQRNGKRRQSVAHLCELLSDQEGLTPFHNPPCDSQPGYYKVGFQYNRQAFDGLSRDAFARAMRAEGIALDPGFRSLQTIHSRRRYRAVGNLPVAEKADRNVLTLHHPVLLEDSAALEEIRFALDKIHRYATMIRDINGET